MLQLIKSQKLPVPVIEFTAADIVRSGLCAMWVRAFAGARLQLALGGKEGDHREVFGSVRGPLQALGLAGTLDPAGRRSSLAAARLYSRGHGALALASAASFLISTGVCSSFRTSSSISAPDTGRTSRSSFWASARNSLSCMVASKAVRKRAQAFLRNTRGRRERARQSLAREDQLEHRDLGRILGQGRDQRHIRQILVRRQPG